MLSRMISWKGRHEIAVAAHECNLQRLLEHCIESGIKRNKDKLRLKPCSQY